MSTSSRQLAAIMFTDIVGYTAMMQQNEQQAVAVVKHYSAALEKCVTHFNGRVLNYYGDGSLCIFSSSADAVYCSLAIQKELKNDPEVPLRIGLHIGEVFFEDDKALGDGVNVASRIQSLGQENTILISEEFHDKIKNNSAISTRPLGHFDFKNINKPMEVFAITNEGLFVPQRKRMDGKLKKNVLNRNLMVVAFSVGLSFLAIFFVYKYFFSQSEIKSIAVLPFVDMSPLKDQEYFSDGLSEELINMLVKVPNMLVTARTSAFAFKGRNEDIRTIASKLNVRYLLEGSVRQSDDRIKVTVQLIEGKTGLNLWSETIEKAKGDILELEDEIANSVVKALRGSLLNEIDYGERQANQDALNQYLQGRYNNMHHKVDKAIQNYRAAIKIDSLYTKAWAGLAWTYTIMSPSDSLSLSEILEKRKRYAQKAYSINPNEPEAIRAMIQLYEGEANYEKVKEMSDRGLALAPNNVDILLFATYPFMYEHRFDEGIEQLKRAIHIDPLNYLLHAVLSGFYLMEGRLEESRDALLTSFELGKDVPGMFYYMSEMALIDGDIPLSLEYLEKIDFTENPLMKIFSFVPLYLGGRERDAEEILKWAEEEQADYFPVGIAVCYVYKGDFDKAFRYLERAVDLKDPYMRGIREIVYFGKDFRADPRYKALLKKLNLPDKEIKWSLYDHLKSKGKYKLK